MAYFYYIAKISIFQELVGETGREITYIFLFSSLGTAAGKTYSVSYFQRLGRRMVFKRTHKHSQNIHSVNNCKIKKKEKREKRIYSLFPVLFLIKTNLGGILTFFFFGKSFSAKRT